MERVACVNVRRVTLTLTIIFFTNFFPLPKILPMHDYMHNYVENQ